MGPPNNHILHSSIFHSTLRAWHGLNYNLTPHNFMYPLFIIEEDCAIEPIDAMPGINRYGVKRLVSVVEPLVNHGLSAVILFGVVACDKKDSHATFADSVHNPVVKALPILKKNFPQLVVACDACLCPYTAHGHCGILQNELEGNGALNNAASIERIAQIALVYAQHGADVIAPSDMMDGRVQAIKDVLIAHNMGSSKAVLSYSVKFASSFYGPFRNAAKSAPAMGDRSTYQLPITSGNTLAIRAVQRDITEGADMIMVKPALAYLDVVRNVKQKFPEYPLFVYQVSGEYAMLRHSFSDASSLKRTVMEIFIAMRRAGADVIISYFTPDVLQWLHENKCKL